MSLRNSKKPVKGKKVAVRGSKTALKSTLAATMEKDFRALPGKLIEQCRKELSLVKQQEAKLKNDIQKAQAQKKTAREKLAVITAKNKTKATPVTRKQLATAKKTHDSIVKTLASLAAAVAELKNQALAIAKNQAKFAAINKQLNSFEKQWGAKKAKTNKPKAAITRPRTPKNPAKKAVDAVIGYTSTLLDIMKTPESETTPTAETSE